MVRIVSHIQFSELKGLANISDNILAKISTFTIYTTFCLKLREIAVNLTTFCLYYVAVLYVQQVPVGALSSFTILMIYFLCFSLTKKMKTASLRMRMILISTSWLTCLFRVPIGAAFIARRSLHKSNTHSYHAMSSLVQDIVILFSYFMSFNQNVALSMLRTIWV